MPFPISIVGSFSVDLPDTSDQHAMHVRTAISKWLQENRARSVSCTAQGISFTAGMFRLVSAWNPLGAISSGEIEVVPQGTWVEVRYLLRFNELLIVVTATVILFVGPPIMAAGNLEPLQATLLLMGSWLWLFGGNYVITRYRVPKALKRTVQQATGRFK